MEECQDEGSKQGLLTAWRSPGSAAAASPAGLAVGEEEKSDSREPQDWVSEQKYPVRISLQVLHMKKGKGMAYRTLLVSFQPFQNLT